jgi:acid phosphatase
MDPDIDHRENKMNRIPNFFTWLCAVGCGGLAAFGQVVPQDPAESHPIPPFTVPEVKTGVAYQRFIVIGDMGTGGAGQEKVAALMADRARLDGLDFWITTGDNFYEEGVTSVDDPQWKSKFEEIYDDPALKVPVYPCLGNHDYYGNEAAQIEYAARNSQWKLPARYHTFTRPLGDNAEVQFFVIDTEPINKQQDDISAQLVWLNAQLGSSKARWKIVYGHHPLYGHHPKRGHNKPMVEHVGPLLEKHDVDVYFAGHDHSLEMIKPVVGVHHVISGAGSGTDRAYEVNWTDESWYAATGGGFVYCRLSRDELVMEFVRLNGKTQYAHVLTK